MREREGGGGGRTVSNKHKHGKAVGNDTKKGKKTENKRCIGHVRKTKSKNYFNLAMVVNH